MSVKLFGLEFEIKLASRDFEMFLNCKSMFRVYNVDGTILAIKENRKIKKKMW